MPSEGSSPSSPTIALLGLYAGVAELGLMRPPRKWERELIPPVVRIHLLPPYAECLMQRLNQLPRLLLVRLWGFTTFSPLHAVVALMVERSFRKRRVDGSNPSCSAICGRNSIGRVPASQVDCCGFKPHCSLHIPRWRNWKREAL